MADLAHRGCTLEEMAALAGARVEMNEFARDLDREVIMGNAATPGEALAQWLAARGSGDEKATPFTYCGDLSFDEEGNPVIEYRDPRQIVFPWE